MNFEQVNRAALDAGLAECWFPAGVKKGTQLSVGNLQGDRGQSLQISLTDGRWKDFATDDAGGDLISLYAAMHNIGQGEAAAQIKVKYLGYVPNVTEKQPIKAIPEDVMPSAPKSHPRLGKPSKIWGYKNAVGSRVFAVFRFDREDRKAFVPLSYNGEWQWKMPEGLRPLYNLPLLNEKPSSKVLVVEGEKAADAAQGMLDDYVVVTSSGGSSAVKQSNWKPLEGRDVIIWPDNDAAGEKYATAVCDLLPEAKIVQLPSGLEPGWDLADEVPENLDLNAMLKAAKTLRPETELKAFTLDSFWNMELPEREHILKPVIHTQSLSMLFAGRGVGKTHIALNIAYAISAGAPFLKWLALKPLKVLYIDGEMPASMMQERLLDIKAQCPVESSGSNFQLLTPDMQENGMPDIASKEGQKKLKPFTDRADFIVIDNLSTLARNGKENESEGWIPIQEWGLSLRSQGKSVMFVHHAGKNGQQRGASKREDVLDLVIELRHPDDYEPEEGARFEVHYTKARGLIGNDVRPFEASLVDGTWQVKEIDDRDTAKIIELKELGLSVREIASDTGLSKSTVQRRIAKYEKENVVSFSANRVSHTYKNQNWDSD